MLNKNNVTKVMLEEEQIPKFFYNVVADMPNKPAPYYNPQTKQPAGPADMQAIFPDEIIAQEMSTERFIEIPVEVRELYKQHRPVPLCRARGLEKALQTPARIYFKYEGNNATGSHKLNTALAQAFYNKAAGIKKLTTETGAGQWGSAISMAAQKFGLECEIFMVNVSYMQKPYRKIFMQTFGGVVHPSPSNITNYGRQLLAKDPNAAGSLGIAISEAVEIAAMNPDTNYSLGSVLNHVCLHQTIIGQESKLQLEMIDEYPDMVIACCGGGTNFAGIAFPFVNDKLNGKNVELLAVEPTACPTLTKGVFDFDYSDVAQMTPIAKMYTLGSEFMPSGIHSGGLRYHGDSPLVSQLYHDGIVSARAYGQKAVFDAALQFAKAEGIIPAPESSHAIRATIDEAVKCRESGEEKVLLMCLSGNGYFDMTAYETYLSGKMENFELEDAAITNAIKGLPQM